MRKLLLVFLLACLAALMAGPCLAQPAGRKVALVIGNSAYQKTNPLSNPANDAEDVSASLSKLGFDVQKLTDGSRAQIVEAVEGFARRLPGAGAGLFYYAGHAVQHSGVNYLIPVDEAIQEAYQLQYKAVSVDYVLSAMDSARGALSIVVLDACRDNPFAGSRGGARGLTVVGNAPAGAIIVYATDPGKTAQDGSGRNGTFTEAFLHHVGTPGLDVKDLFDRVGKEVAQKTRGEQTPWISSKFYDTFSLSGTVVPSTAPPPVTGNPLAEPEGLVLVPAGSFQMGSAQGDADEKPARAVTISRGFYMSRYEVTQEQWQEVMGTKPAGQEVEDLPMANVSWYEAVEYCNRLSRREGLRPCYKGSGESVSCDFSANGYRLPTEAEWEYAARGGNRSRGYTFAGGDSPEEVAWHQNDAGARVHPVGQKKPNELGLYDLSGNLYEWCWDWYGSYAAAMSPDGPRTGSRRVLRGGGWASTAESLRVTNRGYDTPEYKSKYVGFRPVRNAE